MRRISEFIVKNSWYVAALFIALIGFSMFSIFWVDVENDITYYLPESAEAKQGLVLMNDEFITYATADIMVDNITLEQAKEINSLLVSTPGVDMVSFDTTEEHYKNSAALYNITFSGTAGEPAAVQGYENVRQLLSGYDFYVKTDTVSNMAETLLTEMVGVSIIVVIVVIAVLIFTSSTYAEILVLLGTFVTAAIINMGTNFLLGTISFVSNSVAIVLQLALSVDYAIIFCNRYKEEHQTKPVDEAVISALTLSVPEISASSLTTIAGLAAMTFMQFRLGLDMGIALIKSIVVSLLTVFMFMPTLLLACGKLMDKTRHRNFVPKISFVGRFAYKTRVIIPVLFAALVVFAYISFGNTKYAYFTDLIENKHKSQADIETAMIEDTFGKNNLVAVIVPAGDYNKEAALIKDLRACPEVKSVLGLAGIDAIDGYTLSDAINYKQFMDIADVDEITSKALFAYYAAGNNETERISRGIDAYTVPLIDLFLTVHDMSGTDTVALSEEQYQLIDSLYSQLEMAQDQLQGENYSRILVYINLTEQSDETFAFLDRIHVLAGQYYAENVYLTGNSVSTKDFSKTFVTDNKIVGILSISLVMLILLFTFRSIGMPILLILVIQGSIWINFATAVWTDKYVFFMCYLIVSAIQMGANIDYAIVISTRYNSLRDEGMDKQSAIIETVNLSFPTVITSGTMMVIAGLMIGRNVSQAMIAGMGSYVGTGTAISLVLVNFALPQILLLGDGFVRKTAFRVNVSRRLGRVLQSAAAVLLVMAITACVIVSPVMLTDIQKTKYSSVNEYGRLLDQTRMLRRMAAEAENSDLDTVKYDFAESFLTDEIGAEQLAEGEREYAAGESTLNAYKSMLRSGEAEYAAGYAQYEAGLAAYEAGQQKLAAGQAEYDAGAAQLAQAKQTYAEGEAQLNAIKPIYNLIMPYYSDYQSLQQQYDAAAAAGNIEQQYLIGVRLQLARVAFETQLSSTGYSLSQIVSEYQAGEQKLADGAAQIADAEVQLADAKAQLDAGYAELNAAKAQLADAEAQLAQARAQLDSGAQQIAAGEGQLSSARRQIEEGRETLEENKRKLENSMDELEVYADNSEKLRAGMKILKEVDGVSELISDSAPDTQVCSAAEMYFEKQISELRREARLAQIVSAALIACAAAAAAAMIAYIFGSFKTAKWLSLAAGLAALACGAVWRRACMYFGANEWYAAGLLCVSALCFAVIIGLVSGKAAADAEAVKEAQL